VICTLGLIAAAGSLCADWKITTESTVAGQRSVRTEYYKGSLTRTDFDFGGHRRVGVYDRSTNRSILWDLDLRQYMVIQPKLGYRGFTRPNGPAPVLRIEMVTTDTGDRDMLLGRPARHLITTEKRYWEEKPGDEPKLQEESSRDAWYVDAPGLPGQGRGFTFYSMVDGRAQPAMQVNHTGPKPTGFIVREKQTSRYFQGSGNELASENTTEVTELSERPLSQDLFEPPAGFERVSNFPGEGQQLGFFDEVEQYWNQLVNYLAGLFS